MHKYHGQGGVLVTARPAPTTLACERSPGSRQKRPSSEVTF